MTWVRFDDQASIHRKVAPLDDATFRLWHEAIEWCARNLTDGTIRADELLETSRRASKQRAAKLVEKRLWHRSGEVPCDSPKCPPAAEDGWVIHDYLEYQPTRDRVKAELAAKAERTRLWRERKAGRGRPRDASQDESSDPSSDASPSPPRPAPKEAGAGHPQRLPAADGGKAAAGSEANQPQPCPICANSTTSAYHRNVCRGAA